ncbi:unnamed protein product [Lota lota]
MESDVKAIRARFQAENTAGSQDSTGFTSQPGRLKTPLHPTLSSGLLPSTSPSSSSSSSSPSPFLLPKKPALEGPASGTHPPKPAFLKHSSSSFSKGAPSAGQETAKALASRFSVPQEEHSSSVSSSNPFPRGNAEPMPPKPKLPVQKPPISATLTESRPAFQKPPAVMPLASKPSWVRESGGGGSGGTSSNPGSTPSKAPPTQQKPSSAITKLWLHGEDAKADSESKHTNAQASRLPMGFTIAPSVSGANAEKTKPTPPSTMDTRNSTTPPKLLANKKPSFIRRHVDSHPAPQDNMVSQDGAPRRNTLPNMVLLGPAPTKPSRPPRVNLDNFRRDAKAPDPVIVPARPASHPSNQSNSVVNPPLSVQPVAPSLPPRHPGIIEPDSADTYDDVAVLNNTPPPPPSTEGRPRLISKQEDGSDGETYEELDERWEAADLREQEMKEKQKEKKRLEAEKKEQKEREKKENEARKKFKLVGSLEVMHRVKVVVDSRGSKTDLALKKGDWVDIIRVNNNPEGKWLGRLDNGSFGYLKNDCVEVDLHSWKQQLGSQPSQKTDDQEVYDDVDNVSNHHPDSGFRGSRVVLPPDENEEIYDDAIDASLDVRVPPPSQFTAEGKSGAPIDEELYDDIDSQAVPPPLPVSSLPPQKAKMEEIDPKRQKKFEKDEKEFRKKFKYEGEIQVLYQVTIIPTLTMKKLSGKDLPVKPGETLDVIMKAVDNKLVCRNEEGKFGTVLTSHIVMDDGDIYDDIRDECIYDND